MFMRRRGRRLGEAGHADGIDDDVAVAAEAGALTAEFDLITKGDMDHATLAAIHGIESKRFAAMLHLFGGGVRAEAQLGDAKHAVIVGVEGKARMIFGRDPKGLHRDVLQREEKLGFVAEQKIDVGSGKFDHDFRVLNFRI
jgi:hypothetical protein